MKYLIFFTLFISHSICFSATYYVDNSGSPACSNSPFYGSEAQPWCTIQYGIGRLSGGDDLLVKNGTYNESFTITGPSGNAGKSTEIKAYTGHTPKLYGNGINTGRMRFTSVNYMKFSGFEVTNYNQGIHATGSTYLTIENCHVHHVGQDAITIYSNSSYVTVQNNLIHDTRQWQYNGEGVYVGSGSGDAQDITNNVSILNNTIYNVMDEAVELKPGTHDCLVDGNIIYSTPNLGATVGSIEVNQSHHDATKGFYSNPNHIIRNNTYYGLYTAIRAGTGCRVYNNVIYNITSGHYGIYVDNLWSSDSSYTRKIYHNTIDVISSRAVYISAGTTDVKNNIGPSPTNNMATSDTYYVSKAGGNYHLAGGSAPINAGLDLRATVPTDKDGLSRDANPDIGAYEYGVDSPPSKVQGLTIEAR